MRSGSAENLARVEKLVRAHLREPVPASDPRPAATVILLRDGAAGLEVFLMERSARMAFAPSQTVYPGGSVDRADAEVGRGLAAPWADRFGCPPEQAGAVLSAAVREVLEETGVLLAAPGAWSDRPGLADRQEALVAGRTTFAAVLAGLGATLDPGLLHPWARWVTPVWSPRRYDTFFLLAALPPGQSARGGSYEASAVAWRTPAEALRRAREGLSDMFTPTVETLADLADLPDVRAALVAADARPIGLSSFGLEQSPARVRVFVDGLGGREPLLEFRP